MMQSELANLNRGRSPRPHSRGISFMKLIIWIAIVVIVVVGGFWLLRKSPATEDGNGRPDLFTVKRGSFDITIPSSGDLAAEEPNEIRNRLESRSTIKSIVEEGTSVKAGDLLVELNNDDITERIKGTELEVNSAQSAVVGAQSNVALKKDSHESELKKAELEVNIAQLAMDGWTHGDDPAKQLQLDVDIETARINAERLRELYENSIELADKEFISKDELERDRISKIEAEARLTQAERAKTVYMDYQREQDRAKKESDLEQAEDALARMKERQISEIRSLESDLETKRGNLKIREERLAKYNQQLEYSRITASDDGLVVYASSVERGRWGMGGDVLQVGTELYPNQLIMILPNTSKLVAEVKVNEALSGRIEPGQPASLEVDALPNTVLEGEVLDIGVMAESGGWRDPNRRDYTVRIRLINGVDLGLKPSMRCKADIKVGQVDDTLYIPVQAAFRQGMVSFVYLPDGSGYKQQKVTLGRASELYIEVLDGLEEGDMVLLREPSPEKITEQVEIPKGGPPSNGRQSQPDQGQQRPQRNRPQQGGSGG